MLPGVCTNLRSWISALRRTPVVRGVRSRCGNVRKAPLRNLYVGLGTGEGSQHVLSIEFFPRVAKACSRWFVKVSFRREMSRFGTATVQEFAER